MKIYMYDEEYAKSNNVKPWDGNKPMRYILLVLLAIILGGFISVFIAAISPFAFISGLIMVLWLSSCVLLPTWLAIKVGIYQDVLQTAFIYDDGIWWYIKLVYINENQVFAGIPGNPVFTIAMSHNVKENINNAKVMEERRQNAKSYINTYLEAKSGSNFIKSGKQIIHNGPFGRAEVIRPDNLKVENLEKSKKPLHFTNREGKNSKRTILNAFPNLFEDVEETMKEKSH